MKQSFLALLPMAILAAAAVGCQTQEESKPAAVASYKEYTDPSYRFVVKYPENWATAIQTGKRAVFDESTEIGEGFNTFDPKGSRGARIDVMVMPGGEAEMNSSIAELKGLFTDAAAVTAPQSATLNGMPATKVGYSTDLDGTKITGERYYVVADSVMTYLETAVIGTYDNYKTIFDEVRKSFVPGKPLVAAATPVPGDTSKQVVRDSIVTDPPSAEMKSYSGSQFSMSYPANFDAGTVARGVVFSGARVDSKVQVNVQKSQGVALDKIADQSKKSYGGRAGTPTTVAGQKAYMFNYGAGDAAARAYYVVSGDNLFIITTTWYKPQQDLYLPAYDKMLASFKAK